MDKWQKNGILLVLLAALAWSTAGLFTRVVTTDIPTTLFWRSLLGGFCVLAIYLYIQHSQAETKQNHSRQNHIATLREAFHFSRGEVVIGVLSTCGMIFFYLIILLYYNRQCVVCLWRDAVGDFYSRAHFFENKG